MRHSGNEQKHEGKPDGSVTMGNSTNNERKQYENEIYWGKPITGFGDTKGRILFVGLAPAAHGGTRTGRAFTGDKSGEFLFKCLYEAKIANQPISENINDGLKLDNAYVTNILKCVPPDDKPLNNELNNCSKYFNIEISNLKKLKVIVTLGKVAFENCIKLYKNKYELSKKYKIDIIAGLAPGLDFNFKQLNEKTKK